MENFAVLCPELAFKIEYYADAAAYQGSVGTECGQLCCCTGSREDGYVLAANGCWRHGSIQLCMGYCRQRVLLMHLL
jgi:hypothetical protein